MPSRISGIGLTGIQKRVRRAARARLEPRMRSPLPIGGFYSYRQGGETPRLGGAS